MNRLGAIYSASSTAVRAIKADVKARVVGMVELQIKRERAAKAAAPAVAPPARPPLFPKAVSKPANPNLSASHYLALGLLSGGAGADGARDSDDEEQSAAEEAEEIVQAYLNDAAALNPQAFCIECPPDHVNEYWKKQPEGPLKAVARCLLGQAASSAPLENVFSTARDICTRRRSSLAPHLVEMLLVCAIMRRVIKLTPDEVNQFPAEEMDQHLPGRFTRPQLITDLKALGDQLLRQAEEEPKGDEMQEWEWDSEGGGDDDLDLFAGWSSLAAWGLGDVDLDRVDEEEMGLAHLPSAPST